MKLAFIGGGTMAEAIIGGVLSKGVVSREDISVGEYLEERCDVLKDRYGIFATTNNASAIENGHLVVLSVKPQNLPEVLAQLKGKLRGEQAVLSIVAGAKTSTIVEGLDHPPVIRVMPNTPAQIGEGISLWTSSADVGSESRQLAQSVLQTMGAEIYVSDEKYLDMATALSASGPAYVFLFIEVPHRCGRPPRSTQGHGQHAGLADCARQRKADEGDREAPCPAEGDGYLSLGGTTAEALLVLEEAGFRAAVINAVIAAYEKSLELGE